MTQLKKAGMFTDIHFGRKNNSEIHNTDCSNYIKWFISQCQKHEVDHVVFLGDWFEERTAIDSLTTQYAMDCAIALNDMGIPIYFIVGNHDLYYRDSRDVYASYIYKPLSNFVLIDEPTVSEDTIIPTLYSPFLFEPEYANLSGFFDIPVWMGHFEFKGFVLTGDTVVKESGPDPKNYTAPEYIFSGHFHKRQNSKNIYYIGNAFPMDFGDVNDSDRGMVIYDYVDKKVEYINWEDCPKYIKATMSELEANPDILESGARVKCVADKDITFSEHSELKTKMLDDHNLREFTIEEVMTITVPDMELTEEEIELETTTSLFRIMIGKVESDKINNDLLLQIFDEL